MIKNTLLRLFFGLTLLWSRVLCLGVLAGIFAPVFRASPPSIKPVVWQESMGDSLEDLREAQTFLVSKIERINPGVDAAQTARAIVEESLKGGVDPLVVAAVVRSESTFNRNATSHRGAQGLMQLLPSTARYIAKRNGVEWRGAHRLHSPEYNIRLGIAYFKYLEQKYEGDRRLALMAYNWGPANLNRALRQKRSIYPSVATYAEQILTTAAAWRKECFRLHDA